MNIVVLDGHTLNPGDLSWSQLEKLGNVTIYDRTSSDLIVSRAKDAEIVLTNKTVLNSKIMQQLPKLKYVGVLATGYNIIDLNEANNRNICVTNIGGYGTYSVAQHTFALILAFYNRVAEHDNSVKDGEWQRGLDFCYWTSPIIELYEKTLGIIGYGRIGQTVGNIARAMGMKVLFVDNSVEDTGSVTLEELYRESDIITLHCPLNEGNKEMINAQALKQMKKHALIINTARGGLIKEADLAQALNNDLIGGACVDVVSEEPIDAANPMLTAKNCIITPHIAWAAKEARNRLLGMAVENLKAYLDGEPINVVT